MHRITWIAIPLVALVAIGSGVGYWSHNMNQQRQALVNQAASQYGGAFHGLVSDMQGLTEKLGEAEISADPAGFEDSARQVWRLSYAAQSAIGQLPFDLMPMHETQGYLANLSKLATNWMDNPGQMRDKQVQSEVRSYYIKSQSLTDQLEKLQSHVLNTGLNWLAVRQSTNSNQGDNQVIDGLRKMDSGLASFTAGSDVGAHIESTKKKPLGSGQAISTSAAKSNVAIWLGVRPSADWKVSSSTLGGQTPAYIIAGQTKDGPLHATVTEQGGRILNLQIASSPKNDSFGFGEAEEKAKQLLRDRGFGETDIEVANQYDHTGYFILVPRGAGGAWAVDSPITVEMSLSNGDLVGLDMAAYYQYPVSKTASRRLLSVQNLQKRLSPTFHVEYARNVVVRNSAGQSRSAVQFFGTANQQTYAITMDATNGSQLRIAHLS